jgi:hypothetical protein
MSDEEVTAGGSDLLIKDSVFNLARTVLPPSKEFLIFSNATRASTSDPNTMNLSDPIKIETRREGRAEGGGPVVVGFTPAAHNGRTGSIEKHFSNRRFCDIFFNFSEDHSVLLNFNVRSDQILGQDDTLPNKSLRKEEERGGRYIRSL